MDNQLNPKANILIVDDDVLIAESNKFLLKKSNYNIAGIAANGLQAIKLAKEKLPDLILMDINLGSSIDGITAAEEIQKFADIPFIFLTAYSDSATIERAKKVGPFGYLIKPFDNRELIVTIETSIYKHSFEKKIKEQELLFRTVANFAYEWEFWIAPDLRFKYCSPSCNRITGYTPEEFTTNPQLLFDIIHTDDKDAFEEHIQNNYPERKDEIVTDFQFRIIDKQGAVKFISHTCSSIYDDKNTYLGRRGTNVDITERKLAEEQIREANLGLQLAIEGGDLGTFNADITTGKVIVNDRYVTMLGYSPGEVEITKELWHQLIHPEDLQRVLNLSKKIETGEIKSMEADYRAKHKSGNWIWIRDRAKGFDYTSEGKPTRSAGTHRDITSAKQAEEALRQSEEKMRLIVEGTSFFFFYAQDTNGDLTYISPTVEKITGRKVEEWMGQRHWFATDNPINLQTADRTRRHLQGEITADPIYFELTHKNGSVILLEVFENPVFKDGKVIGIQGIAHDITESSRAQEAIRQSEERFKQVADCSGIWVWEVDAQGLYTYVSPMEEYILGYKPEEVIGKKYFYDFFSPDVKAELTKAAYEAFSKKEFFNNFVNPNLHKDGHVVILETTGIPMLDENGNLIGYRGADRDITEKRQMEEALRQSEEIYRELYEKSPVGYQSLDEEGRFITVNDVWMNILGYKKEEVLGKWFGDFLAPEYVEPFRERFPVFKAQGQIHSEFYMLRKNGERAYIVFEGRIGYKQDGEFKQTHCVLSDQTARKLFEESLKKQKEEFETIFNLVPAQIWYKDAHNNFIKVNRQVCEDIGLPNNEIESRSAEELFPSFAKQYYEDDLEVINSGKPKLGISEQVNTASGELRWVHTDKVPVFGEDGKVNGLIAFTQDVTERKLAEEALKVSEQNYREIYNSTTEAIFIHDAVTYKIIDVNDSMLKMYNYNSREEYLDNPKYHFGLLEPPFTRENAYNYLQKTVTEGPQTFEWLTCKKNGEAFWTEVSLRLSEIGGEKKILAVVRDIDARKKAEEALHESEKNYRMIFNSTNEAIFIHDASTGKILDVNDTMLKMYGYDSKEELLDNIDNFRANEIDYNETRALELIRKAIDDGPQTFEWIAKRKNGEVFWTEVSLRETEIGGEGKVLAVVRDITDRKQTEEALRESENNFRLLFENAPLGIYISQTNGKIIDANNALLEIIGSPSLEATKQINVLTFPPLVKNGYAENYAQCIEQKKIILLEMEYTSKWGKTAFLSSYLIPLTDEDGIVEKVYTIMEDITERKKAEVALRENKERWESLFNNSPNAIAIYQAVDDGNDFLFTDFNLTAQITDKITRDEVVGKRVSELFPGAEELGFLDKFRKVWLTGNTEFIKSSYYKDNRLTGWRENIIYKLNTGEVVAIYNDVTERMEAEMKIRQSEQKFRSLFENASDPILLVDFDGHILDANPATCNALGYECNELCNMKTIDLNVDEYKPKVEERFEILRKEGKLFFETIHRAKNGSLLQFEISSKVIEYQGKKVILSVYRDITERKLIEKTLKERNAFIQTVLDNLPIGIALNAIDQGTALYFNKKFLEIYGWPAETLKDIANFFQKVYPDENYRNELITKIMADIQSGDPARMHWEDCIVTHKDGSKHFVNAVNIPLYDQNTMVSTVFDVTTMKEAEIALRESEEKFRSIFENHSAIKLLVDPDTGNIVDANQAAANYYGWTRDELNQMNITQINTLPPEEVKKEMENVRTRKKNRIEFRHRLKDGSIRDVEIFSSKINIGGKDYLHSINHDITDRVKNEKELKIYREHLEDLVETRTEELDKLNVDLMSQLRKEKELEMMLRESLGKEKELNELKTRFISTASHEFRTPLTTVLSSVELLQRFSKKWDSEKTKEHYDRIYTSVSYVTQLLDEVLMLSRTETGKTVCNPQQLDLHQLCSLIIDDIKSSAKENHNFVFKFMPKENIFTVDSMLLKSIITNLLGNAVKYSPDGGKIELQVRLIKEHLVFEISDQGLGIPEKDIANLFEPFHRCENSADIPGTGLGLSIVKQSVELHNGEIKVESTLGKGTTFTVKIKL